jgi:histone arginine demethylase JMJD6
MQCFLSELNDKGDWSSLGHVDQFDSYSAVNDNVERIHVKDFPPGEFIEKYERLYKPVVICGIQNNWKAKHKWTCEVICSIRKSKQFTGYAAVIVIVLCTIPASLSSVPYT